MTGGTPIINKLVHEMASADDRHARIALGQQILNHVDLLTSFGDDMKSQLHDFKTKYEEATKPLEIGKP